MATFNTEQIGGYIYYANSPIMVRITRTDYQAGLKYIIGGTINITISFDSVNLASHSISFPLGSIKGRDIAFDISKYVLASFPTQHDEELVKINIDDVTIYWTDDDVSYSSTTLMTDTEFHAVKGYSFISSNKPNEIAYGSNLNIQELVKPGTEIRIPYIDGYSLGYDFYDDLGIRVDKLVNGSWVTIAQSSITSTPSNESDAIKEIVFTKPYELVRIYFSGSNIDYVFGNIQYRYIDNISAMYEPIRLEYLDRMGLISYLYFNGNSQKSTDYTKEYFERSYNIPLAGGSLWNDLPTKIQNSVQAKEKYLINSGWTKDSFYNALQEVLLSSYIKMTTFSETCESTVENRVRLDSGVFEAIGCTKARAKTFGVTFANLHSYIALESFPITINTQSIKQVKNREQMVNYQIEVEVANPMINNRL